MNAITFSPRILTNVVHAWVVIKPPFVESIFCLYFLPLWKQLKVYLMGKVLLPLSLYAAISISWRASLVCIFNWNSVSTAVILMNNWVHYSAVPQFTWRVEKQCWFLFVLVTLRVVLLRFSLKHSKINEILRKQKSQGKYL